MALDALAGMLARDWNRIIWKEGCNNPATSMISAYDKLNLSPKDDGVDLSAGYNALNLMLRLDNLLGACAAAIGGFCHPPTTTTIPCDDDGWVRNAKLHIMISTDLAACSPDVPNVTHVINFNLTINGN
jgi:hypothetical protein